MKPDYDYIRQMELESYGTTFAHAGAQWGTRTRQPRPPRVASPGQVFLAKLVAYVVFGYMLACLFGTLRHPGPQFWIPWH
jgi:hypothetical protein